MAAECAPVRPEATLQPKPGSGSQTRKLSARPRSFPAEPPPRSPPAKSSAALLGLSLPPCHPRHPRRPGPVRAEVRRPPGPPWQRGGSALRPPLPPTPGARRVGFRTVPCDVAARRGRPWAGGWAAGPGGADPGRGEVSQLDGRGRPERRRRCRTLLGGVGGSQQAPRSWGAAAACRLDNKESESWGALLSGERLDTWICSLLGSLMVGLSGVFPLLVIPLEMGTMLRSEAGARRLKQLLSFALGGLLGNVFLHLLPEAWAYSCSTSRGGEGQSLQQQQQLGLWVIAGFLTFLALEKMFLDSKEEGASQAPSKDPAAAAVPNGGRYLAPPAAEPGLSAVVRSIKVSGYLNLLANTIDNFTHGLAVAASFLVSKKRPKRVQPGHSGHLRMWTSALALAQTPSSLLQIGLLTTVAILLHEIPHEVGDFAILLRAGFDRWSAAKLQLSTALGGLLGACFAICTQSPKGVEETVAWILPFTSGGFLYIALVNVLPDLLEEDDPWHSLQQMLLLCTGIVVMVLFSLFVE
ncbi:Zinc transporter ZIP13 [Galemys pyrenaicus]|uniref:Zinc transporter ZIP13 n=1 Tax=Galemys pyrenaicus TaxID=202257 RepID=A0A8J6AHK8_GALPY|nr:Zinc transporter ZIP13 [Galemys pyrenaicus]